MTNSPGQACITRSTGYDVHAHPPLSVDNNHSLDDFFNNLDIQSTFTNILLPFGEVHLVEGSPYTALLLSDMSS